MPAKNKYITFLIVILVFYQYQIRAQNSLILGQDTTKRVINTAVPFLSVAPDARAAGMGDVGVATSPDANSIHWNPAKLVFVEGKYGFSLSYSPWLRNIVNDMSISYLSGYYKLDELQAVGASLRYFNLGSITFTDDNAAIIREFTPNEFAFDVTYSRKLSDYMSAAITGRFIYSNLTADLVTGAGTNQTETKPGVTGAADIGFYYNSPDLDIAGLNSNIALGFVISNIGAKITYTNQDNREFIPTNMRLGTAFTSYLDSYNRVTLALDVNKLLVPTPPLRDSNGNILQGSDPRDVSLLSGMFGSFSDAPDGFSEELQEFSLSAGAEYWYTDARTGQDIVSFRLGYFTEHVNKGNRKYFSVGLGGKYNVFGLDVAYLIPQGQNNPLAETLRFTLSFDFEGDDDNFGR